MDEVRLKKSWDALGRFTIVALRETQGHASVSWHLTHSYIEGCLGETSSRAYYVDLIRLDDQSLSLRQ